MGREQEYRKKPEEKVEAAIRTFTAYRRLDISETHDENQRNDPAEPQYEGIVFSDGKCVIRWLTAKRSVSVWDSFGDMFAIHGHPEYGTEIIWHDSLLSPATDKLYGKINKMFKGTGLHLCWIEEDGEVLSYGLADEDGDEIDVATVFVENQKNLCDYCPHEPGYFKDIRKQAQLDHNLKELEGK